MKTISVLFLIILLTTACSGPTPTPTQVDTNGDLVEYLEPPVGIATRETEQLNRLLAENLPLDHQDDFANAKRGFLAKINKPHIRDVEGNIVWDVQAYDFLAQPAPPSVNPSLWRQSRLAAQHGLFEVVDGIYQIRGYDLAVMTVIRGETGWIVVDPLTTIETAAASLKLLNETLGERPVSALIYTHSHADHFGGAGGVIDREDMSIPIIAPEGFSSSAIAENVVAGNHMARRASFMFGNFLPKGKTGHIGAGLGPGLSGGTLSLILPTEEISADDNKRVIDGVQFEFIDAKGTEAPAEFMFYLPQFKALCTAEVATATIHNALTLRGAKARDTLRWSQIIDQALVSYGARSDVSFASHHWPKWGSEQVQSFLKRQRDIYRYTHDQTLRHANAGLTPTEIAETVPEPKRGPQDFTTRGYYGTLNHNTKAVYQFYFGWWDGVPANYYVHPPVARASRLVEAIGGIEKTIEQGRKAFSKGDYRWSAELFNAVVFADEKNKSARQWLASSYEQLGFQSESGAWRSYYLSAALELRDGVDSDVEDRRNEDLIAAIPTIELFDAIAVRYVPESLDREPYSINFEFTDTQEKISVEIGETNIFPRLGRHSDQAVATFTISRAMFDQMILGRRGALRLMLTGELDLDGDRSAVSDFFGALDTPSPTFDVVTP